MAFSQAAVHLVTIARVFFVSSYPSNFSLTPQIFYQCVFVRRFFFFFVNVFLFLRQEKEKGLDPTGFEPVASPMQTERSAAELRAHETRVQLSSPWPLEKKPKAQVAFESYLCQSHSKKTWNAFVWLLYEKILFFFRRRFFFFFQEKKKGRIKGPQRKINSPNVCPTFVGRFRR